MKVIGKDRKREQIDTKASGQTVQLMFDPLFTMIKVFASDRIGPKQKAATDNAIGHMHNSKFGWRKNFNPGEPCHDPFRSRAIKYKRKRTVNTGKQKCKSMDLHENGCPRVSPKFEEQMVALLREYKGYGEYLSVHHPAEQDARDDAPDCTALAVCASAGGGIGEIVFV